MHDLGKKSLCNAKFLNLEAGRKWKKIRNNNGPDVTAAFMGRSHCMIHSTSLSNQPVVSMPILLGIQ